MTFLMKRFITDKQISIKRNVADQRKNPDTKQEIISKITSMKPRLYFDTSVFGGVYDREFEKETKQLFEMVNQRK